MRVPLDIDILVTDEEAEARSLTAQGFCPVECAFGAVSVVDDLRMDHHGELSGEESVAVRAFRDHRCVLAGVADADATFAIAALAGLLPEPETGIAALAALADTIAVMDVDPIGRNVLAMPAGDLLLTWNALFGGGRDRVAALAGVHGWRLLTDPALARRLAPFVHASSEAAAARRKTAEDDLERLGRYLGRVLLIEGARGPGFDVWYGRRPAAGPPDMPSGWAAPVVVASDAGGVATVGCPNATVAAALFGSGGLRNVYPVLAPVGWGGREAIGGAPRGRALSSEELHAAALAIDAAIVTYADLNTGP